MNRNEFHRVAIVGSGAIGLYYGARLALAGVEVRFLMRGDLAAVRARGSLILREKNGATELRSVAAFGSAQEIGPVDLVIVTLKTTANGELMRLIPPLLGPQTIILTLQNGLGSDERLAEFFGAERVAGGLAFIAATRTAPGEVTCLSPGRITLGEFGRPAQDRTRIIAALLENAGIKCPVVDNLAGARWGKLAWNIPFNGLSIAAGGITTDQICADPALAAEARMLMKEVQLAAAALGFTIIDEFLRGEFEGTPKLGAYRPSSLIDFQAGREVEIEAIWGEPLRRAQAAGVGLPRLEMLYALLKMLTAR